MTTATKWKASDVTNAKYLGEIEFQTRDEQYHDFHVMALPDRLVFGGACNAGFLESGYMLLEDMTVDEALQELVLDLEAYYNDGPKYVSKIVCNERM